MPQVLLDWLRARFPAAKQTTLRRMVGGGRVSVNGAKARSLKHPVGERDEVVVRDGPPALPAPAAAPPFRVVYEDDDLLVIDKPPGLLTSTVAREKRPTALAAVREYLRQRDPRCRAGLIHRLDRDASGLLVFSKNEQAYASLKRQFFHHSVDRVYLALVHGAPRAASGRIESRLLELPDGRVVTTRQAGKGKRAITDWIAVRSDGGTSLLRVKLLTGRKHQIRAHLAEAGTPIVNDRVYGTASPTERLMLVAVELGIDHPRTGRRMRFAIKPPAALKVGKISAPKRQGMSAGRQVNGNG